ncbi:formaldehyde-activating enzyme [Methylococcus sp. ANG]|jgi:5,6,7,8-tetrahydromethanopterin hydro-lyase|uniref:formaldehyde-activating enzyme n=1 Tax=unclassified Methylococcus TaxID=2618889 RepID=UPI001C5325E8|nr:formaldehyde-activating enzyme [Methylococcus sp. Mc7]QXP85632.1 formaldehyde-activating enzyme [Methylococcus sp. Mc7]
MNGLKIDRVLVGEALVGEGNELAHIDLIMGPRGSAAELAFCTTLTNQKRGDNALLALVAPNLMAKPATVMFNKVEIKNEKQATQMFGPAERGVAKAVVDSVKDGIIPKAEAEQIFICVGVFIHWDAQDNAKIQDWNYQATKLAIARAVGGKPGIEEVIAQEDVVHHPLAAHD